MATAQTTIILSVTRATQAEANSDLKQGAVDFVKSGRMHLPDSAFTTVFHDPAEVDSWTVSKLEKAVAFLVNLYLVSAVKSWRVQDAEATHVDPVREAAGYLDPSQDPA